MTEQSAAPHMGQSDELDEAPCDMRDAKTHGAARQGPPCRPIPRLAGDLGLRCVRHLAIMRHEGHRRGQPIAARPCGGVGPRSNTAVASAPGGLGLAHQRDSPAGTHLREPLVGSREAFVRAPRQSMGAALSSLPKTGHEAWVMN